MSDYKTPEEILKVAREYVLEEGKGIIKGASFLTYIRKANIEIERYANGKPCKLPKDDNKLSEYMDFLWGVVASQFELYRASRTEGGMFDRASALFKDNSGIAATTIDDIVSEAYNNGSNFTNTLLGKQLSLQPINDFARQLYLLSLMVLQKSNNVDLKRKAKDVVEALTKMQEAYNIFDFPIMPLEAQDEVSKYLKP